MWLTRCSCRVAFLQSGAGDGTSFVCLSSCACERGGEFGWQKLVELISAVQTSKETLDRARAFAEACGKGEDGRLGIGTVTDRWDVKRSRRRKTFLDSCRMRS